jgi:hypothetical protein
MSILIFFAGLVVGGTLGAMLMAILVVADGGMNPSDE